MVEGRGELLDASVANRPHWAARCMLDYLAVSQNATASQDAAELASCAKRKAIVVLGMHRSGTSALAGALRSLGIAAPKTLMLPNFANPSGFWESNPLVNAHDELLARAGSRWDDWRQFDPQWTQSDTAQEWREKIRGILVDEYGASPLFFIKDPRICRFAPFTFSVLHGMDVEIVVLLVFRNPLEVALSLQRRDGIAPPKGWALWLRHTLDAEYHSRHLKRHFLTYEALLTDWRRAFEHAAVNIGVTLADPFDFFRATVDGFLSRDLHHERQSDEALRETAGVPAFVLDAYRILRTMRTDGERPELMEQLDRIRRQFEQACDFFGPVFAGDEKAVRDLRAQAAREGEQSRHLRTLVDQQRDRLTQANQATEELQAIVQRRDQQMHELHTEISATAAELEQLRGASAATAAENDQLRGQLSAEAAARDGLQSKLLSLERDNQGLREQIAELERRTDDLRASLERSEAELQERSRAINDLNVAMSKLQDVVAAQQQEITSLRRELERLYQSWSWLVTRPLPAIDGLRRKAIGNTRR